MVQHDIDACDGDDGAPLVTRIMNEDGDEAYQTVGVHVGSKNGTNLATLINKRVLVTFIQPTLDEYDL